MKTHAIFARLRATLFLAAFALVLQGASCQVVKPSVKALSEGKYPLVKPHYLVTTPKSSAAALEFARFVASAKGRAILARVGYLMPAAGKGR